MNIIYQRFYLILNTDYNELIDFIDNYGFEAAASKYSISDTSSNGGKNWMD